MSNFSASASPRAPFATLPPAARPLSGLSIRELERCLAAACATRDGASGAHAIHELAMRGTIGTVLTQQLDRLWASAAESIPDWLPMRYVAWLPLAYEVCAEFRPATHGRTHVYLILLDYADSASGPHGVYVGASRYGAAVRFDQHKQGLRTSGAVLRRGLEPLSGPVGHLQHLSRTEAEAIEQQLAQALRARGLIVKGGH